MDTQNEIKRKWKNRQILGPCKRIKTTVEHESDGDIKCSLVAHWMIPKVLKRRQDEMEIKGRIETILITELSRSTRILRRLVVS